MAKMLVNIKWQGPKPTLDEIGLRFGVAQGGLDATFGVIAASPQNDVFTILVEESEVARFTSGPHAGTVVALVPLGRTGPS